MKKTLLVILCLLLICISANASPVEDESWLGAYLFKDFSATERYYPYVDIREQNYSIMQPGNVVRSVFASYIIAQSFSLVKDLQSKNVFKNNPDINKITGAVKESFAGVKSAGDYSRKLLELKALLLLKGEIAEKKRFMEVVLGSDYYNKFYYDFYHLSLTKYETSEPTGANWESRSSGEFQTEVDKVKLEYISGAWTQKMVVEDGALDDSVRFTERINGYIPILPAAIAKSNSPLISVINQPMDLNLKKRYATQFGDSMTFVSREKVNVIYYRFNKQVLLEVNSYFYLFDDGLMDWLINKYKPVFGNVNTDCNLKNLTGLLKGQLKI